MFWKVSEGVKKFCKTMVDNHNDWKQYEYEFVNTKTGLGIRTSNGISYLAISGQKDDYWNYRKKNIYTHLF